MSTAYTQGDYINYGDQEPISYTEVSTRQGDVLTVLSSGVIDGPGAMRWDSWGDIESYRFPMTVEREG